MHFRPADTLPGRTAIELWDDGGNHVATVYATRAGITVTTESGAEPHLNVDLQTAGAIALDLRAVAPPASRAARGAHGRRPAQ